MNNQTKPNPRKKHTKDHLALSLINLSGAPVRTFPGPVVDPLRHLVTKIGRDQELPARLSLVSALRGEGVTYIVQALAATIANDLASRVCVVDLNWWWPSTSPLAAPDNPGLAGVLIGEAALEDVIAPSGRPNMALLPAGRISPRSRPKVARGQTIRNVLGELESRFCFDHLILDIPAVLATNDAVPLASLGTACCLVVRQGVTSIDDVRLALDEISHLTVLGTVLNQVRLATPDLLVKMITAA